VEFLNELVQAQASRGSLREYFHGTG
jgi:hypothetical protein